VRIQTKPERAKAQYALGGENEALNRFGITAKGSEKLLAECEFQLPHKHITKHLNTMEMLPKSNIGAEGMG
jgi:hypothetical protein